MGIFGKTKQSSTNESSLRASYSVDAIDPFPFPSVLPVRRVSQVRR